MTDDFRQKLSLVVDLAGASRSRLAREIGVDKSVVSRWLSGATRPSTVSLQQLTDNLASQVSGLCQADWALPLESFRAKFATNPLRRVTAMPEGDDSVAVRQEVTFCPASDGVRLAVASLGSGRTLIKAPSWLTHVD